MSLAVTLPLVLAGRSAVNLASDFEETQGKFDVVFSDLQKKANETADNFQKNFGLSGLAARQLLSNTGDLLTGFGFSQEAAFDLSTQVNELAADLASFSNFEGGTKGASEALTKALLGEAESAKSLGIVIQQNTKEFKAQVQAQMASTGQTALQAKAIVILRQATEQSGNAIGDFARTQDSFANQARITRARLEDLGVQIGQILMPIVQKVMVFVKGLIERFSALSPATKKVVVVIAALVAAIGPLLIALGFFMTTIAPGIVRAVKGMISGFRRLFAVIVANPIGALLALVAAITIAIIAFAKRVTVATLAQKKLAEINVKVTKGIKDEKEKLNFLFQQLKLTEPASKKRKEILDEINQNYPDLLANMDLERATLDEITAAYDKVVAAVEKRVEASILESELTAIAGRLREIQVLAAGGGDLDKETIREASALRRIQLEQKVRLRFLTIESKFGTEQAVKDKKRREILTEIAALEGLETGTGGRTRGRVQAKESFEETQAAIAALRQELEDLENAPLSQGSLGLSVDPADLKKQLRQSGITKITSAAPKIFNINIETLVENINNNVNNMREGMNESKQVITEVLLEMLSDVQSIAPR